MTYVEPSPTGGSWEGHRVGTTPYKRLVVALFFGGFASSCLIYSVQVLLPMLAKHYQVSAPESAQVMSATTGAMMVGLVVAGPVADRVGRARLMRWSLLLSGTFCLISAFVPTLQLLLIARVLIGLSLCGFPVSALAYLREEVHTDFHLRANGMYVAGMTIGGTTARLLPIPLHEIGGWALAASVIGLIGLSASALLFLILPAARRFETKSANIKRVLLGTFSSPRDPVIALICVIGFASMGINTGLYNSTTFRLAAPPLELGAAATLVYIVHPLGAFGPAIFRRLTDRLGRGYATAIGVGGFAVGLAILQTTTVPTIMIGLAIGIISFVGIHALLTAWVVDRAQRQGSGTAQASSAYLLTFYLGSTVIGIVATHQWDVAGWNGVALLAFILIGIAAVATLINTKLDASPGKNEGHDVAHW
ncbi:MAG: MFS transporter [Propionibacteriaceae bacterium]|nr:MFS transporter [Propionibacteriaceae bacterium]